MLLIFNILITCQPLLSCVTHWRHYPPISEVCLCCNSLAHWNVCIYVYVYIYIHTGIFVNIYITKTPVYIYTNSSTWYICIYISCTGIVVYIYIYSLGMQWVELCCIQMTFTSLGSWYSDSTMCTHQLTWLNNNRLGKCVSYPRWTIFFE